MQGFCSFLMLLGRVCLSIIFILAGLHKFVAYDSVVQYMQSKELKYVPFLLVGAALVEILGGLTLIIGWKTRWSALVLFLFLIPTTIIFHDFWNSIGLDKELQINQFLKNLAIAGGLLYVIAVGPGALAVHRSLFPRN